jgi:predicted  nucleic acid-binding Zn-ribbon protein
MAEKDFERLTRLMLDEFKQVNERFEAIDTRFDAIDARFDTLDARFDAVDHRFDTLDARLSNIEVELRDIRKRLEALEAAAQNTSGFTKEIDHLLRRVVAIEKHLGLEAHIKA